MVMSMTGYGFSSAFFEHSAITVEIKTVNNRYLDFAPKMPRAFLFLESRIKETIMRYFQRGRVEVYIGTDSNFTKKTVQTDWDLLAQYMEQLEEVKHRYGLTDDIPIASLLSIPEVMTIKESEERYDIVEERIIECVEQACEQVITTRKKEGLFLLEDIKAQANSINKEWELLKERRIYAAEAYRHRVRQRIDDYAENTITMDQTSLLHEIAVLSEKGDITEEMTRLFGHLEHFWEIIEREEPIGRKLDFIMQEMLRETNTIGAKSTDTKISHLVVSIKSNIEKIKEQIQNLE
ncbi:YicC/YloC family endoribonuclease [Virgibacillus sp. W0181]|uniref:YicC/YloC family endoribonuclease n=1 Tax=Virgibacillus sp. W0181 TaxID=3391581 RepID=UPI003F48DCFC